MQTADMLIQSWSAGFTFIHFLEHENNTVALPPMEPGQQTGIAVVWL